MKTTLISLGGSLIVPNKIDFTFLKKFKKLILDHVKKGHRVVLVCGGGKTCRTYQEAAGKLRKVDSTDKDWVGIMATRLNAELIRVMFGSAAYERVVYDPHEKVKTSKKIIIAAGHKPGCTTDTDMVIMAKSLGGDLLVNTTDVDYVYDKDPNKYKGAKKIKEMSWKEFSAMFGGHKPGMHVPFDPVASRYAAKNGLKVAIVNGKKLVNLKKMLDGKRFVGTLIG